MLSEDAVTRLVAHGAPEFIKALTESAIAQDRLTASIAKAGTLPPSLIAQDVGKAAIAFNNANIAAGNFAEALKSTGASDEVIAKVTSTVQKQTRALLENADAAQKQVEALEKTKNIKFQETAARNTAVRLQEQGISETRANALFKQQNPLIANGPKNIPDAGGLNAITSATKNVTTASTLKNKALLDQDAAHKQNQASGISYLSVLSAIHAASFLATGTTFSLAGSLTTLGLVGAKVGQSFGVNPIFSGVLGVGVGTALIGVNALITGFQTLISISTGLIEAGAKITGTLIGIGGAGAVAATKLAGNLEAAGAEIVAFGEPTKQQFQDITAEIFKTSNATGIAAVEVGKGASLFIRAGGDIEKAIDGGVAAVARLTVASRGELIPSTAARAIVTITNAFQQQSVTVDQASNILVGAAQRTALSFNEVTQAFQQAGPEAAQLNIPLIDLATTIGLVANAGLKGQLAGTGFKQFLLDLIHPSAQARTELDKLGISIVDSVTGRIRPLRDVFEDLHKVLGQQAEDFDKTADASKAQSLAIIFGSRANLAAAIIARTTTEEFDKLKDAIASTSTQDIVDTLLAPTNAQLEIAKTRVENLATAFGGPLNVALGSVVKQFNTFLETVDPSKLQALSQGVLASVTGQGFGPLIEQINSLDNSRAREFFTGLAATALTVRGAIVDQLLPALSDAAQRINDAFQQVNITETFTNIANSIVAVVSVGAGLTTFVGGVVADFISGNQRGQELRNTLAGIATVVGTSLVGAFVAAAIPIAAIIPILSAVGEAMIGLLSQMNKFNSIWDFSWQLAKDSVNNFLKAVAPELQANGDLLVGIVTRNVDQVQRALNALNSQTLDKAASQILADAGDIDRALLKTGATALNLQEQIKELEKQRKPRTGLFDDPGNTQGVLDKQITDLREELDLTIALQLRLQDLKQSGKTGTFADTAIGSAISQANTQIEALKNAPKVQLADIFGFTEGELPEFFTNLASRFQAFQAVINRGAGERTSEPGTLPDPAAAKRVADQIRNLTEDTTQKVFDINSDAATKEIDLRRSTFDKLNDLTTAYQRNVRKLDDETARQLQENEDKFQQRLADRSFTEAAQNNIKELERTREEANAHRDLSLQQFDAANERREQRRIQDADRDQSILQQLEQQSQDRITAIQDTAFQRRQSDAATLFDRQQNRQADQFSKSLQAEARARDLQQKLANAKTPAERQQVQSTFAQSELDRKFQESQDTRLQKFRENQENQKTTFSRSQEDQAFTHRITNEVNTFNFRVALENKYQTIKRALEDREFVRTDALAEQLLERRLGFTRDENNFKDANQKSLQSAQDFLANRDHAREQQQIKDTAAARKLELGTKLSEDIFNIFSDADSTRTKNLEQQQKQLRTVGEGAARSARSIIEQNPSAKPTLDALLFNLQAELVATDLLFQKNNQDANILFNSVRDNSLRELGVPTTAPTRDVLQSSVPLNPNAVGQAVRAGQQEQTGLLQIIANELKNQIAPDNTLTIAGNVFDTNQVLDIIRGDLFKTVRAR